MIFVDDRRIDFTSFPDGTSSIRIAPKLDFTFFAMGKSAYFIRWMYDNDAECMQLWYLVKHLKSAGNPLLYLEMPYIPNARMDRVKNRDEVFTLKWFAEFINSLGFESVKVLDPHVKALYGDSITPQRCEAVYKILMEHGFAINNVSLGVGSFSMQCLETMDGGEKTYAPYTRDTFGIAVKATYAEDADGKSIMIFKNPKTDSGHFKKSQRGCCKVVYDYTYHNFFCQDGLTWEESQVGNWLQPVFKDGKLLRVYTLDEVRKNLHEGNF